MPSLDLGLSVRYFIVEFVDLQVMYVLLQRCVFLNFVAFASRIAHTSSNERRAWSSEFAQMSMS